MADPKLPLQTAVVANNADPEALGRVQVRLRGRRQALWADLAAFSAGPDYGGWFLPEVDDEVLVSFIDGDPDRPVVIGALWSERRRPPQTDGRVRQIRTPAGHALTFDDTAGSESITLVTAGGQTISLQDDEGSVAVEDANGNQVTLAADGVTVDAAVKVTVNASTVEINAAMVTVNSGTSKFSGVVQCDTLIANAVVSASYTPGAGNVL